ncbi:MAG: hypothetical protein GY940_11530 [bacterium]|nr:hypothetical protein [bacterium]
MNRKTTFVFLVIFLAFAIVFTQAQTVKKTGKQKKEAKEKTDITTAVDGTRELPVTGPLPKVPIVKPPKSPKPPPTPPPPKPKKDKKQSKISLEVEKTLSLYKITPDKRYDFDSRLIRKMETELTPYQWEKYLEAGFETLSEEISKKAYLSGIGAISDDSHKLISIDSPFPADEKGKLLFIKGALDVLGKEELKEFNLNGLTILKPQTAREIVEEAKSVSLTKEKQENK